MSTESKDDPLQFLKDITGDSTLAMAAVGAAVTFFGAFLPVSPVFGGMLAGYLTRGSTREGIRVGAYSGAVAAIPLALIGTVVLFFGAFGVAVGGGTPAVFLLFIVLFMLFVVALYYVGLSAAGGWIGVFIYEEYTEEGTHVPTPEQGRAGNPDDESDDPWSQRSEDEN